VSAAGVYITSFRWLDISEPIAGKFELIPGVHITNDPAVKARLLTSDFATFAGLIEFSHLHSASNIVFCEFSGPDMQGLPPDGFLLVILVWIEGLFESAWLVKDHAMRCDGAYLKSPKGEGKGSWSSNFLMAGTSFAGGEVKQVEMSLDELRLWSEKQEQVWSYLAETHSMNLRFMMEKGYTRSGRALRFVSAARSARDLAFKIAHFCSALETLFSTETAELSHKLSERAAFFLSARGYDRLAVFRGMKKAYVVRSKLVHGDTLSVRQIEELPSIAVQLDGYLRTILNAIFQSDELKQVFDVHSEGVDEYFTQLIFGK
jgi:hypothetical protein